MVAKTKAKKKQTTSGQATRGKVAPMTKTAGKKLSSKGQAPKKQSANTAAPKKEAVKAVSQTPKVTRRRPLSSTSQTAETDTFSPKRSSARSGAQSGDMQGLSSVEGADSESVVELLEEGNSFEAAVVAGVEDAGDPSEVHTHEVPEDDVPEEYLDRE